MYDTSKRDSTRLQSRHAYTEMAILHFFFEQDYLCDQSSLLKGGLCVVELLFDPVVDGAPVDGPPPFHQIFLLSVDAKVGEVDVFPGADTESGHDELGARRELGGVSSAGRRRAKGAGGAVVALGGALIDTLLPVDGLGVRGAGIIRGQEPVVGQRRRVSGGRGGALFCLDEPDEARAVHGVCGGQHCLVEDFDAAEGSDEGVSEGGVLVERVRGGRQRVEEEVGVVGHAGGVEDRGKGGVAGEGEDELLCRRVLVVGAWVLPC